MSFENESSEGPNWELWDALLMVIARWMCQERAQAEVQPADGHIVHPGAGDYPCDGCIDASDHLTRQASLVKLLQTYGAAAYAAGKAGLPESEAVRSAMEVVVARARQIEEATVLLDQVGGNGWLRLPLERDERERPLGSGEDDDQHEALT